MTYSSAYFEAGANDLETAQRDKYRRIVEAAGVREGYEALEIGCGWGAASRRRRPAATAPA